ncbi:transglutaminase family protein [Paraneptunicella aestuarii]|uniref:transglutaminase-like domain-containing protein n=1 Tax=Paraneptunicella aestuarii TaxID=2831148 RepID=UPI001E3A6DA7|nr:transglutaminase family protein [Paraneptunicella aestuarii]UAA38570.1 transglutaminase family protein [Paraneptunicella aestuarii]
MDKYLQETPELDFSHPGIQELISRVKASSNKEKAVELYYLVRDDIRYNPYTFIDGVPSLTASYAVEKGEAFCVPKSALMVAAARGLGIPARLGLANVRNHLSSPKLLELLRSDLFVMHGYAELFLDDQWVKCTPVFNVELCQKFGVVPLEFDGETDSIFHPYTENGQKHMEYVTDHGTFDGVPVAYIMQAVAEAYPHLTEQEDSKLRDFAKDSAFE